MKWFVTFFLFGLFYPSFSCSYGDQYPKIHYPLLYEPGKLVLIEGEVTKVETDSCVVTSRSVDSSQILRDIALLDSALEKVDSSLLNLSNKSLSTAEDSAQYKNEKRKMLLLKLKKARWKTTLKRSADTSCAPSRFYLSLTQFNGVSFVGAPQVYFTLFREDQGCYTTVAVRDTTNKRVGSRYIYIGVKDKTDSLAYGPNGNILIRGEYAISDSWFWGVDRLAYVKPSNLDHKYKTLYFFLKNLYEARTFSKKYRLVKKHKDLFLFNERLGDERYLKMIKLNFPKATEEQKNQLLALKNLR